VRGERREERAVREAVEAVLPVVSKSEGECRRSAGQDLE